MSRADVIRALTDEELAELILHWDLGDEKLHFCKSRPACEAMDGDIEADACRACLLARLKEKAGKC